MYWVHTSELSGLYIEVVEPLTYPLVAGCSAVVTSSDH